MEIALNILGGYCVIADVAPYHADTLEEAEDVFRTAVRSLIRVNTMDSLYNKEVERTNRIGVSITGIHEFAWKFFGYNFYDLIDEEKSKDFWQTLAKFNAAVRDEAKKYARYLDMKVPHTMTTVKPSGTISKLFGLTEGWHLPSMAWYMRWVQFREDDPQVEKYQNAGYPVKFLKQYQGVAIVGFPTEPAISNIMDSDKIVTAADVTPEEQYKWLMLGEKYWIIGINENGEPNKERFGNQISYTLKYNPDNVSYDEFKNMLFKYQSQIRCCSVMPQVDMTAYEYQPEQPITKADYEGVCHAIEQAMHEDIGREHAVCEGGACPVDFEEGQKE